MENEIDYKEACDRLTTEITEAIARSLSHDEKVTVSVDGSILRMSDAFEIIGNLVDHYDTARENDGSEDVWGEFDGDSFRLNVYTAIRAAADINPNNCILAIIHDGCGIVTDDEGNGCAGPSYLDAETLDDMHSSDAFITASVEDFDEARARYAFESVGVSYDPDTTWIQVELQRNTQGWRQVGWIWK